MKLPMSWLKDWVELDASPEQVAEALTTRGFYVEAVETRGRRYPGVVIARVLEAEKHPNADKLKLCRVDGGSGELKIVCGAPNVAAGMIVPLATVGTTMPNGLVIKAAKIRGEESQGMLCSGAELGLTTDADGIMILPPDTPLGVPLSDVAGVLMSPCASTHSRPIGRFLVRRAQSAAAATEPAPMLWSPPRTSGIAPSSSEASDD